MSSLLLRLASPLQSWGVSAKFDRRETQRLPTKSGVIGLLASALGRRREDSLDDLNALVMGVRADQEGEILRDYHTARTDKQTYISDRYYLSDAVFVAALQGEDGLLTQLEHALKNPVFPLYLGRRSCPPEGRVLLGIRSGKTMEEALREEPWQASQWYQQQNKHLQRLQVLMEASPSSPGAFYQQDVPLSFDQAWRRHGHRSLRASSVPIPKVQNNSLLPGVDHTSHDAFADWGE